MTATDQVKPVVLIAEELSPATVDALGPDFEIRQCDGADRADLLPAICATTDDSLQVLRTALSAWGGITGQRPFYDADEDERQASAMAAVAITPTILAAAHRLRLGLDPVPADPDLPHATDYLRMVTGRLPAERDARSVEQDARSR